MTPDPAGRWWRERVAELTGSAAEGGEQQEQTADPDDLLQRVARQARSGDRDRLHAELRRARTDAGLGLAALTPPLLRELCADLLGHPPRGQDLPRLRREVDTAVRSLLPGLPTPVLEDVLSRVCRTPPPRRGATAAQPGRPGRRLGGAHRLPGRAAQPRTAGAPPWLICRRPTGELVEPGPGHPLPGPGRGPRAAARRPRRAGGRHRPARTHPAGRRRGARTGRRRTRPAAGRDRHPARRPPRPPHRRRPRRGRPGRSRCRRRRLGRLGAGAAAARAATPTRYAWARRRCPAGSRSRRCCRCWTAGHLHIGGRRRAEAATRW